MREISGAATNLGVPRLAFETRVSIVARLFIVACALILPAMAQAPAPSPLAARFTEVLHRAETGHSPAPEELASTADPSRPIPSAAEITEAFPLILKALDAKDADVRMYTLLTLQAFRSGETNPVFKAPVAKALTPAIPRIAAHLSDESAQNAVLTTVILGGFAPSPPAAVYPPLIAYLKRDDAVGDLGLAVVQDLLGLGPIPDDATAAVVRYLRRADQTSASRSNLIDAIVGQPYQSIGVNLQLVTWLDSDDPSVRARLILSLPQLDLTPSALADTRARVGALAQNDSESLQVVTAAKAIAPCWTAMHMTTPCPVYETPKPGGP